ncbi:MAG: hypothetical protein GDA42_06160 [Ekhidna sp.]|nr:hypothetical protein [Ekhidna sp.]MBC6410028.1 hypothetical protein [Ekhidna sp.]
MTISFKIKDTRIAILFLLLNGILSCNHKDEVAVVISTPFVRFFLLVDADNKVVEHPRINSSLAIVDTYHKVDIRTLKVPVTLSYPSLQRSVSVDYRSEITGNLDLTISPKSLTFEPRRLVDTLYITTNKRWDHAITQQLKLQLLSTDDPGIHIGIPNSITPNHTLTVDFGNPALQYTLSTNRVEIRGEAGEKAHFDLNLPRGYFPDEIVDQDIFRFTNGFDYTLEREEESDTRISYRVTLTDTLSNDFLAYESIVALNENNGYQPIGITSLQIVKPVRVIRDISTNPAGLFYDLSDPFHRTYGENWGDFNEDGSCDWTSFFAFSFPVEVDADHENAILYDDQGTSDPSDDVYHHAFKIGFGTSSNPSLTTNSFNFKRWFKGESNSSEISPGFNVNPALEFFPEGGTSTTRGTVSVESQIITIGTSSGSSYNITISGEGTYRKMNTELVEVSFTLSATNDELFGGMITSEYFMYNQPVYPEPTISGSNNCINPYDL